MKITVIAGLLLGVASFALPIHAAQQETSQGIKQRISKKTATVAIHASVAYNGQPQFVPIAETSISYATNSPQEVIHIGSVFYLNLQDVWLLSGNAQGPWKLARYVPEVVAALVCSQLNAYPLSPYQLCALPWASELSYSVWKPL